MNPITTTLADGFWHWLWFGSPAKSSSAVARIGDELFMYTFWLSVAWFVFLMGLTFYFVVKYQRRPGKKLTRSPAHNTPLEIAWTVVPTVFLVYIFFKGFWGYADAIVAPANAEVINLKAQKWAWRMTYPNGAESPESMRFVYTDAQGNQVTSAQEAPIFVVPAGKPVQLRMSSMDVIHSFWVPDFRSKFDIFPNRYTSYWFQADEPGDHVVYCAEYCGDLHSEMYAIIRVLPEPEYRAKINSWAIPWGDGLAAVGKVLYTTKGCSACHSVDGSRNTGPTWKGIWGKEHEMEGGGKAVVDPNYIRGSILVPGAKIVKRYPNQMVSYQGQLNDRELDALIAYIESLGDNPPAPGAGYGESAESN
ncbi:MAG: cytochrome c oxidase subunit II [Phycisphaeraceae bacterium]|nr:cytochrome c oxidase subunit II [Phycisphaeraceae bacterium]